MIKTIGLIGCGNMGGALLGGLVKNFSADYSFLAYTRTVSRLEPYLNLGVELCFSAQEVAAKSDLVIIAVKPGQVSAILNQIAPDLTEGKILLSVAAGISIAAMRSQGVNCPIVRSMPDTPALVGKGVFALAFDGVAPESKAKIFELFSRLGLCLEMAEEKIPAFSALIGAGPAYVFAMMQAFVQAGVTLGFGHKEARSMVEALFEGSAVMAKESPEHLMALRDQVLSPAGLTIAGTNTLDRAGLTGILVDCVLAAYKRGQEMEG